MGMSGLSLAIETGICRNAAVGGVERWVGGLAGRRRIWVP